MTWPCALAGSVNTTAAGCRERRTARSGTGSRSLSIAKTATSRSDPISFRSAAPALAIAAGLWPPSRMTRGLWAITCSRPGHRVAARSEERREQMGGRNRQGGVLGLVITHQGQAQVAMLKARAPDIEHVPVPAKRSRGDLHLVAKAPQRGGGGRRPVL